MTLLERAIVIGVMGPGEGASDQNLETASQLGAFIARSGWVLLSGGRDAGVMQACNQAARESGGMTLGLLPGADRSQASPDVLLPLPTGLGHGRNVLNILASDMVVVCGFGMGAGTLSEIALALKTDKPTILVTDDVTLQTFLKELDAGVIRVVTTAEEATSLMERVVKQLLEQEQCELLYMSRFAAEPKVVAT